MRTDALISAQSQQLLQYRRQSIIHFRVVQVIKSFQDPLNVGGII